MASKKKLKHKVVTLSRQLILTGSKVTAQQALIISLLKSRKLCDKDYYVNFEHNIFIMYEPFLYMYFIRSWREVQAQLDKGANQIAWDIFGRKGCTHDLAQEYIKNSVLIPAVHDIELATLNEVKEHMKGQDTNASN